MLGRAEHACHGDCDEPSAFDISPSPYWNLLACRGNYAGEPLLDFRSRRVRVWRILRKEIDELFVVSSLNARWKCTN